VGQTAHQQPSQLRPCNKVCPTAVSPQGRPGSIALKQSCLSVLRKEAHPAGQQHQQLWELGLVSRLSGGSSIGCPHHRLAGCDRTPEAMEATLLRAQGQKPTSNGGAKRWQ